MSEKERRRWRRRWWNKAAWHIRTWRAERGDTWRAAVRWTETSIFTGAGSRENGGGCDRCLRQAGEEVDFWLIQADSCEPPPKCSVEEILAFHRIHPSTHPRCLSALPLSVSPLQTLLTPSIWPPPPTPTVSLLHFYVLFRLSRGSVTRFASIGVFVGEKKAKKKERKKCFLKARTAAWVQCEDIIIVSSDSKKDKKIA